MDANGSGVSSIRNVTVDGNLLGAVTAAESAYFAYPAGTVGGVALPKDNLTGVEVRNDLNTGAVNAASIEGVAFATLGGVAAASVGEGAGALSGSTRITNANDTFRVTFGDGNPVSLFADTANDLHLNDEPVNFTDESIDGVGVTVPLSSSPRERPKIGPYVSHVIETDFVGAGGSMDTYEPVQGNITSTGALGDLYLRDDQNLNSITAPSVIGNIDLFGGSITGTLQTTSGDLGRAITNSAGVVTGVTYINAGLPAGARIISRGNLISSISTGTLGGTIAAQGNIGLGVLGTGGKITRFGGITASSVSAGADIVALGNIYGDISVSGTFAGRLGAKGFAVPGVPLTEIGILGNVTIGTLASTGAVVSGGLIGDANQGTSINITSSFSGFLASIGAIKFNASSRLNAARTVQSLTASSVNAAAINAIWTNGGVTLAFDINPNDLAGLGLILTDLNAITLSSGGVLSGTTP